QSFQIEQRNAQRIFEERVRQGLESPTQFGVNGPVFERTVNTAGVVERIKRADEERVKILDGFAQREEDRRTKALAAAEAETQSKRELFQLVDKAFQLSNKSFDAQGNFTRQFDSVQKQKAVLDQFNGTIDQIRDKLGAAP